MEPGGAGVKIDYVHGDILEQTDVALVVHGCNARGVMGKGLALAVKRKHPEAFRAYRWRFEESGLEPGEVVFARCERPAGRWIANLVSQDDYRRGARQGGVRADYDAIERGVELIDAFVQGMAAAGPLPPSDAPRVAFPLIGAGLAGGDWPEIARRIEARARHFTPTVFLKDGRMPMPMPMPMSMPMSMPDG